MKRWQALLVGLLVSVLALYFALRGVDFSRLQVVITQGKYIWLIPVFGCSVLSSILRAFRWKALLNERIQLGHSFNILVASYLFNILLPIRLGEVVRAFMTSRLQPPIPTATSLSTVVVERIMDLFAVLLLATIAIIITPASQQIADGIRATGLLGLVGLGTLILFAAQPKIPRRFASWLHRALPSLGRFGLETLVERILDGIVPLRSLRTGLPTVAWTLLLWFLLTLQIYLLLFVFYISPSIQSALLVTVFTALAVALPAAPANVGPFEASVVFALSLSLSTASNASEQARALGFAVLFHVVSIIGFVSIGWVGLAREEISLADVLRSVQRKMGEPSNSSTPANK